MYELFLSLHVLAAIFAVGPLVHIATTAARGLRSGDALLTASSARSAKIYTYVTLVVVILGFGLMSMDSPFQEGEKVAGFDELWIWLSVGLWVVATGLALGVVVPALEKATATIGSGGTADAEAGKVGAVGGVIALCFALIVFLMVYQPGS